MRNGSAYVNALANANARRSPGLARRSEERQTHHSGHTSHYHLLQGTSGCAMARLMSRFANALANANARRSLGLARRSEERQTHHSGHTSHYHLLQGTSGCAMARLMSRFANALANANARRSPCLARRSVKLTTVVTLVTSYHLLQGTSGCAMARLMLMR